MLLQLEQHLYFGPCLAPFLTLLLIGYSCTIEGALLVSMPLCTRIAPSKSHAVSFLHKIWMGSVLQVSCT